MRCIYSRCVYSSGCVGLYACVISEYILVCNGMIYIAPSDVFVWISQCAVRSDAAMRVLQVLSSL